MAIRGTKESGGSGESDRAAWASAPFPSRILSELAEPELIHRVVSGGLARLRRNARWEFICTARAPGAMAKVLAAYDAGCRRFDAAMGGLGGCPFAQDELVGNMPTEEVIGALQQRGLKLPVGEPGSRRSRQ